MSSRRASPQDCQLHKEPDPVFEVFSLFILPLLFGKNILTLSLKLTILAGILAKVREL